MPNDIAVREDSPPPALSASQNLLAQVIAAAKDPSVDADKMKTLADLVNSQQDRERLIEFNQSLNAAIMEMPVITKDGVITIPAKDGRPARTQGRFAKFEDIDRVVRPILQRHGLALRFDVGESNGTVTVRPILSHSNGHTERGEAMKLPLDTSGSKNNTQGAGSAVSYGKRYTMCAMLNIITEGSDDDGMGGRLVPLPHERAETVLLEAEKAHEAGTYNEFFKTQSPKDRAWLLSSGNHARLGGEDVARIAPPTRTPGPEPEREDPPAPAKKQATTPRDWVDGFKTDVDKRTTVDALDVYVDGKREALEKLKGSDEALWQEAQDAITARREAIEEGRLV